MSPQRSIYNDISDTIVNCDSNIWLNVNDKFICVPYSDKIDCPDLNMHSPTESVYSEFMAFDSFDKRWKLALIVATYHLDIDMASTTIYVKEFEDDNWRLSFNAISINKMKAFAIGDKVKSKGLLHQYSGVVDDVRPVACGFVDIFVKLDDGRYVMAFPDDLEHIA